jgi:integrase
MRKRGRRVLGPYYTRGRHQLVLVDADGSRGVESFATKERAEDRKRELEEVAAVAATTIDEAIDAYERHMIAKGNKATSYKETVRRMRRFFGAHLDLELDLLTVQRAKRCYEALAGMAADSHRNMLAEAKTFLRWCVSQRWLRKSPLEEVQGTGRRKKGKAQLRLDEARAWRAKAHELAGAGEEGAVAALMTLTMGLRASEITGRKVRDLDDGGRLLWIEDAKTDAGTRTVAVPEELQGYLRAQVEGRGREEGLWRGKHWRDWPRENVQRICRAAGVPEVTAHGMRGLAATLAGAAAILAGGGLGTVPAALGHVDARTTEQSYADRAELEKARRKRALKVLDGGKE